MVKIILYYPSIFFHLSNLGCACTNPSYYQVKGRYTLDRLSVYCRASKERQNQLHLWAIWNLQLTQPHYLHVFRHK